MTDLSDFLIGLECKLVLAKWLTVTRAGNRRLIVITESRLETWACAAVQLTSAENIASTLENLPPERRWRFLRLRLPEPALIALEGKVDDFLTLEAGNAENKNQELITG